MCGRFSEGGMSWIEVKDWTGIPSAPDAGAFPDSFNVKPTNTVPLLFRCPDSDATVGVIARWGLIPHWHKGSVRGFRPSTFNARDDKLGAGMWRGYQKNRCILPAAGYYEWKTEGKVKRPHFIYPAGNAPGLLFAGLWSKVKLDDFEGLSCTIITEAASDKMSELHDRQPVMVPTEAITDWLGGCALVDLPRLKIEALAWHEVAAGVGRREAEGPDLVLPVNSQT